jgi:acetoin utilization deacetylase AcuC-like enzyme
MAAPEGLRVEGSESGVLEFEEAGRADRVGDGSGRGFNVNVPLYSEVRAWAVYTGVSSDQCRCDTNKHPHSDTLQGALGDADYVYVMERIVAPMARQFKPQLVVLAAG